MKRWIAVVLLVLLCALLCACGESAAKPEPDGDAAPPEEIEAAAEGEAAAEESYSVEDVRAMIDALQPVGEIEGKTTADGTIYFPWYLERAGEIEAAEAAVAALPEEQRAQLDNLPALYYARASLDTARQGAAQADELAGIREAEMARFNTEWISLSCRGFHAFEPFATESYQRTEDAVSWSEDGEKIVWFAGGRVIDDDGIPLIVNDQNPDSYTIMIRSQDYDAWFDRHFVAVELTEENVSEWIGEYTRLGDTLENGKAVPNSGVYAFRSLAYDQGLVYLGSSPDFSLEFTVETKIATFTNTQETPFALQVSEGQFVATLREVQGTIYFVRDDYVAANEVTQVGELTARVVTLKDGSRWITEVRWETVDADYADWIY